jgi:hypothetical protein
MSLKIAEIRAGLEPTAWNEKATIQPGPIRLAMTEILDYKPGLQGFSAKWRILTENEASEHYASIGYVARSSSLAGRRSPRTLGQSCRRRGSSPPT